MSVRVVLSTIAPVSPQSKEPRSGLIPGVMILVFLFCACCVAPANADLLLLKYLFNETGTTATSSGSVSQTLYMYAANGAAAAMHSAAGLGVQGGLGLPDSHLDRCFNNTSSTGMGRPAAGGDYSGGGARASANVSEIECLVSFTLSAWFKTDTTTPWSNYARIAQMFKSDAGYELIGSFNSPGSARWEIDASVSDADAGDFADTQKWVFIAMTYDGTATAGNLKFYKGYRTAAEAGKGPGSDAVQLMSTHTANMGTTDDCGGCFTVGNMDSSTERNRPFDGYLDNVRLWGTKTAGDASGAIGLSDLEKVRHMDVGVVPEPSSVGLMTTGLMSLFFFTRGAKTRRQCRCRAWISFLDKATAVTC